MMKSKDVSAATSLLIQGYLRANSAGTRPEAAELSDCINAIRSECDDWSENLESGSDALEPSALSVDVHEMNGAPLSRTPYNLISAAVALAREAVDLNGPSVIEDLVKRINRPDSDAAARIDRDQAQIDSLLCAASVLSTKIDASADRPAALLDTFWQLVQDLRGLGVNVEDSVRPPANWA